MLAPKIAKPQTKAAESPTGKLAPQRSTLARRPFGSVAVEQSHKLQRSIGNQATIPLLSQRDLSPTGMEPGNEHEQEAARQNMTAGKTPRGVSWDFSKIPVLPPDRANRLEARFSFSTPRLSGILQPKLVVGQVNDPLEHEADRIADQVMRMPDPAP